MRRIQGQGGFAPRDPYDERKKSRESVIANLFIFASFIGVIRALIRITKKSILAVPQITYSCPLSVGPWTFCQQPIKCNTSTYQEFVVNIEDVLDGMNTPV